MNATKPTWSEEPSYASVGNRTIMNTDFPVENKVMRTGPRQWTVLFLLCNGAWDNMRRYRSRAEAYAAAGITA